MKKSILALGLAFAALTLPSCSQNEELDVTPVVTPSFELYANIDTRTVNDGVKTNWVAGDQINVFHAEAGATEVEYVNDNAFETEEADGLFKGSLAGELTAEAYDWFALYPYSSYVKTPANTDSGYITVGAKVQTQNGNNSMAHLAGSNCPLVGVAKGVAAGVKPEFTMNHITAVAKFVVKNTLSEAITVNNIYFTAPDGQLITGTYYVNFVEYPSVVYTGSGDNYTSNVATLKVNDGTAIAAGESAEFYLAMVPFTLEVGDALNIKVSATVGEDTIVDEADVELDNDLDLKAGHIKVFNVNFDTKAVAVIEKPTIAEFLEKEVDSTVWYELTGTIKNLVDTTYGNFDLVDETGSVYVYGLTATQVAKNDKSFASIGLKEGDVVTLMGTRAVYNNTAQVGGPAYYVSHKTSCAAPEISFADNTVTITAEEGASVYYTTNGDEPTTASTLYTEPFAITETVTVKAIAVAADKANSVAAEKLCTYYDPNSGEAQILTAEFVFADMSLVNDTAYDKLYLENVAIKLEFAQGTHATSVPKYYTSGASMRIYKGNTFSVSGGNISKIEMTLSQDYDNCSLVTGENGTLTYTSKLYTWEGLDTQVDFYNKSTANSNNQIRISKIVVTYTAIEGAKQDQSLSFEKATYNATLGKEFTAPTVEGAKTTVTYTSSNTDVATVVETTGAVTLVGAGSTTITATAAETEEYNGATAFYTLTVSEPAVSGEPKTVSIDFSQQNYENQTAMTTVDIDENISVTFAKNGGSTNPQYYTSGTSVRLYAKGTMTVTAGEGKISQIKLTFGSSDKTNEITTDTGSYSNGIWTGDSESVVFTVGGTKDHRRIKAVEVTYSK